MSGMTFSAALVTAFVPCKANAEIRKAEKENNPDLLEDLRDSGPSRAAFYSCVALAVIGGVGTAYAGPIALQALGRFSLTCGLGFGVIVARRLYNYALCIQLEANRAPDQQFNGLYPLMF